MQVINSGAIGKAQFSGIYTRKADGFDIRYVIEAALLEWLGDNWTQEDLAAVVNHDPWLRESFYNINDDGTFGYSPIAIALVVALSGKATADEKSRAANLIFDWLEQRSAKKKSFGNTGKS